ncbi:putative late blight resistance protein homolog R1A-3 [Solanum stenotomum]|uniref:putative late blight resistance protein homolog R1A-3 n=1 Tax=Solanum stenotomum TaxID=172797 RepID=UPI0020D1D475|nr:putative late blight resistance protein homolog R1A-3 [Solanum stenotomum]
MAENEIEEMLNHLRRIKSGGNLDSDKIDEIKGLEVSLRVLRTVIKYHHVLFRDSFVKHKKNAKLTMAMLHQVLDGIPDECKTNLNLERLESHLLEFVERDTILNNNYELNDLDLSECMDCLEKNLNDLLILSLESARSYPPEENHKINHRFLKELKVVQRKLRFLTYLYATEINGYVNHEKLECLDTRIQFMANNVGHFCLAFSDVVNDIDGNEDEDAYNDILKKPPYLLFLIVLVELEMKKIFLSELKASKFTHSRTFKYKKLPRGFSHHLHSLLIYLRKQKLKKIPDNNVSAQNIDVAIEFLLFFLDADVSNHDINGNWLNEVLLKVGDIVGDVLYVMEKLLPSSKDDTSKIRLFSIQILEKTKDLKAQVETYYKSLKFTPSQFPIIGGLSFLDSLLRKLNEMSKSKSDLDFLMMPLLGNLEKELSTLISILEEELSSLSSTFRDVAKVHHEHKIPQNLQRRTFNLAYEAEVAIDSIQYNAFLHIFCSLPTILKEIKKINAEVTEMWSADVALQPCYVVAPFKHLPTRHSNPVTDEEIVGFGNDTKNMIQYLIRGTKELDVIPIVGMGGQGKTTIARKVYNSDNIVSHFYVRAWCVISQTYNRRDLLQDIFSQVTGSKDKGDKDDVLADMLKKSLTGKRYLIVLDDMWDCIAWDDLRFCFPDVGKSSRIVVTTRLEKVGKKVKYHTDPYFLPLLKTEESCQLLQRKVFQQEGCPPELQYVSLEIAKKCKGLPLVVVLVAGIIKKRKSEESWWNEVKDALFDYLDSESEEYSRVTMQLSFDNLADCLKPCLLYMGMFPEDARIPVYKLISLWVAEGFVQNSESAEDYLMDLISSNVVMLSKRGYNEKVKYCQVHDIVHHFCLEESRKEEFMQTVKRHVVEFQPLDWKGSRVRFSFSKNVSKSTSLRIKTQKPFHQHLRSLITIGEHPHEFPLSNWIHTLLLLKVLDLSSNKVRYLSTATLKPLNHLKYLAVKATKFYFDPESRLPHLETLMVNNDCYDTILLPAVFREMKKYDTILLPAFFWEMEKLRHVDIFRAEFDLEEDKQGLSSKLENLRILKNIVRFPIDRMDVLSRRCPNLQQLHITFHGGDSDSAESFCLSLENLTQLQILHLSLGEHHIVSGLQLPSNLNKLVLSGIPIKNLISFIAGLPSLEYLQLQDMYFPQSGEWCLGDITFHKLKLLKLVRLGMSRWDASEESFPLLETLVIRECDKLEEIPLSFADIPTLKQIKLIYCHNDSLEDSAERIKKDVEENEGNDRIDVIITVSRNKLLCFVFKYLPASNLTPICIMQNDDIWKL